MKGSAKELVIMIISIAFVLSLIAVGVYFYSIENDKSNNADAIISKYSSREGNGVRSPERISADLEQAKSDLTVETIDLRYYRAEAGLTDYPMDSAVSDSYTLALISSHNVVNEADIIMDDNINEEINNKKANIKQVLDQWKNLIDNSVKKDANTVKKAQEYAKVVETNIEELKTIVYSLTPENSDLTPSQIKNYQTMVDNAVKEINNSVSILEITQPETLFNNPDNQNGPDNQSQNVITPEQIQEQQNIANNTQAEIIYLENELNQALASTSTPSTYIFQNSPENTPNTDLGSQDNNATYSSPQNTDNSGKPRLIEGMNPIN